VRLRAAGRVGACRRAALGAAKGLPSGGAALLLKATLRNIRAHPCAIRENARPQLPFFPDIFQTDPPRISRIDTDKGGVESAFIRAICG
jgi:hypothetical protein